MNATSLALSDLAASLDEARHAQDKAVKRAYETTQPAIDLSYNSLQAKTHDLMVRYISFKTKMDEERELGSESFGVYSHDPEKFVLEGKGKRKDTLRFHVPKMAHSTAEIPLSYFDDPDAWERGFIKWADGVEAMVKAAESYVRFPLEFNALDLGLMPFDTSNEFKGITRFLSLHVKEDSKEFRAYYDNSTPEEHLSMSPDAFYFILEIDNGNLYQGFRVTKDIKDGKGQPLACIKS